jgi:hypothetical protein
MIEGDKQRTLAEAVGMGSVIDTSTLGAVLRRLLANSILEAPTSQ